MARKLHNLASDSCQLCESCTRARYRSLMQTQARSQDGLGVTPTEPAGGASPPGDAGAMARLVFQLAEKADHDPAVRSRVQSLVRVAYGVPSSEGGSSAHNPLLLATETVKGLALGVAALTAAQRSHPVDDHWQHAIAVALTSREVARRVGVRDRDRAFVAGFLHDVGLLLPVLQAATAGATTPDPTGMQRSFPQPADHPGLAAGLAQQWDLAAELVQAVRDHHRPDLEYSLGQPALLTRTLQVADWLAASQAIVAPGDPAAAGAAEARSHLRLDDDALEQLCLGLDRRVSQVCAALGLRSVSGDLAARTLFRLQLRRIEEPTSAAPAADRGSQASLGELVTRISEALLVAADDQERLAAFCRIAALTSGVERVRCGLSGKADDVLVAVCSPEAEGGGTPAVRRMSLEAWKAVLEDQTSGDAAALVYLELPDKRRLDLLVRIAASGRRDPIVGDMEIGLRLLALSMSASLPEPVGRTPALEVPAVDEAAARSCGNDALRTLGEMAAGSAHDVNNALAVVLGQAQLGQVAESVAEARGYFSAIERASRDCASIVRRLQEFARNAREPRGIGDVDLAALARETLELTRPRWKDDAQRRGAAIRTALDLPSPVPVKADAAALRQVVTNLILNAVDAMPAGGAMTIRAWSDGDRAHLSVSDTGIGMSEDTLARVFDPFFTTKRESGTGLGLAVAKRIMNEHGGDIRVTSRPGLGSVFTISLPYLEITDDRCSSEPVTSARRALRVLLIDDEPQVREVLIRMLRLDGHQAAAASTAGEGLDLLKREAFDLVMTDLGLPDMPGWQLARAAKSLNRPVPVVLVTGWTEEGDRPTPVEGVDAVLAKPFGMAELRRVIRSAVELKTWATGTGAATPVAEGGRSS